VKLFVYGSLRAGERYHHLLEGATLVAKRAWTRGLLYDTGWGYPGMIPGRGTVFGEVYRVDGEQLKRIDHLEGFPWAGGCAKPVRSGGSNRLHPSRSHPLFSVSLRGQRPVAGAGEANSQRELVRVNY